VLFIGFAEFIAYRKFINNNFSADVLAETRLVLEVAAWVAKHPARAGGRRAQASL
jgi:hypothetical protein